MTDADRGDHCVFALVFYVFIFYSFLSFCATFIGGFLAEPIGVQKPDYARDITRTRSWLDVQLTHIRQVVFEGSG